jgi:hypothetical protein
MHSSKSIWPVGLKVYKNVGQHVVECGGHLCPMYTFLVNNQVFEYIHIFETLGIVYLYFINNYVYAGVFNHVIGKNWLNLPTFCVIVNKYGGLFYAFQWITDLSMKIIFDNFTVKIIKI